MRMRHAAVVAGLALGLMSGAAKAAYIVNIDQVGSNVIAAGSGSIDFSAFQYRNSFASIGLLNPSVGLLQIGSGSGDAYDSNPIISSGSFGTGIQDISDIDTGPIVSISPTALLVPTGYTSGTMLTPSTSTFLNQSFTTLGLTVGTYTYTFATASEGFDTFTINIGVSPVPLPASAPMFGAALLALGAVGYGVKRKKAAAAA